MFRCDICGEWHRYPIKRNGERICKACNWEIVETLKAIKKQEKEEIGKKNENND